MKKTFQLNLQGKHRDRVLEAVKHEIRQYIARERRKTLPEGVDYWDFDCKFGTCATDALPVHVASLTERINVLALGGGAAFYLELLAKPAQRTARSATPAQDPQH